MSNKLKPCPFCGSSNVLIGDDAQFFYEGKECDLHFYVQCLTCGSCTDVCADVETAIEMWNRRASDD